MNQTFRTRYLFLAVFFPSVAFGQSCDGMYVLDGFTNSCDPAQAGMDGGPALVEGDRLLMLDTWCTLANPVNVRDMDAVLYDGSCFLSGIGGDQSIRIKLGRSRGGGLVVVFNGHAFSMPQCVEN